MRTLFQIVYFSVIVSYVLPIGGMMSMAQDMITPNFSINLSGNARSCFDPHAYPVNGYDDHLKTVLSVYGDAAKSSSVCSS